MLSRCQQELAVLRTLFEARTCSLLLAEYATGAVGTRSHSSNGPLTRLTERRPVVTFVSGSIHERGESTQWCAPTSLAHTHSRVDRPPAHPPMSMRASRTQVGRQISASRAHEPGVCVSQSLFALGVSFCCDVSVCLPLRARLALLSVVMSLDVFLSALVSHF
jgi:hypothetical protein